MQNKIYIKKGKEEAILRWHPWVFSGAIHKTEGDLSDGCQVQVFTQKGDYLGTGYYQDATIAIRLMCFAPERPDALDADFWKKKLGSAYDLRTSIGLTQSETTNVYRLIHGEGDYIPGLIIDCYDGNLVIQAHAVGHHLNRELLADALAEIYGDTLKSIYYKSHDTLPGSYKGLEETEGFLRGTIGNAEVKEYGNRFEIDFVYGQKTGFFIDQRENRHLLGQYAKGRKVLNTFCYSGGFSVFALAHGAKQVVSVDSSKKAIALTEENIRLNFGDQAQHQSVVADAIDYIKKNETAYDLVVLDPPAFAKHNKVRHKAVQAYKRLNAEAIRKIAPGGILFTFSCSQVVNQALFKSTVVAAAIEAGRKVRILHQLTQPADHPVNAFHPEGEYLKGLVLFVE